MTAPLVSFVMPCYGYGHFLRDCLDSILSQEGGYDIEVIAVNDASPDDTIDILRSYSDPRLKVIDRRENKGHIFTVNEGLAAASGKYVVRIDPDDRYRQSFLAKTIPILEQHPEVGLVYGNIALINAEGKVTRDRADEQHGGRAFQGNELIALLKKNFICAPTVVARREAWMSAWPVPDGLAFNDWYFNIMLARKWDYFYCDEVLAEYRVHGSNWHSKVSKDGTEEKSVIWLLNKIYSEIEADPSLEKAKQAAKSDVYAEQYLDFATKYFGHGMNAEARRCYAEAFRWQPSILTQPRVLRQLLASFIPRSWYEAAKHLAKLQFT